MESVYKFRYYEFGADKFHKLCKYVKWVFVFISWRMIGAWKFGNALIATVCAALCIMLPIVTLPVSPKTVLRIKTSDHSVQLSEKNEVLVSIPYEQLSIRKYKRFGQIILIFGNKPLESISPIKIYNEISKHNVFCFPYNRKMKQDFPDIFSSI